MYGLRSSIFHSGDGPKADNDAAGVLEVCVQFLEFLFLALDWLIELIIRCMNVVVCSGN